MTLVKRTKEEVVEGMLLKWLILYGTDWVRAEDILPSDPNTEWIIVTNPELIEGRGIFAHNTRRYRLTPKALQIINRGL